MTTKIEQKTRKGIRFYHPDHLGSTTVVTDLDGEVTQNVAYIPYGEVFVEQRNGTWNTPYLFNAKELDEETGLYYYGARYLDPTNVAWLSVDPLFEKYVGMTPYNYFHGNPIVLVDPDGRASAYEKYNKLHPKEQDFVFWNPISAMKIEENSNEATQKTIENYGYNGWRDESDAFRHACWNAINAQTVGEDDARTFGDAHEYSTPIDQIDSDLIMDIHNNDVGVEIGKNNPNASPEQLATIIKEKIKNGELLIVKKKEDGTPQIFKSNGDPVLEKDIRRLDVINKIKDTIIIEILERIQKENENK